MRSKKGLTKNTLASTAMGLISGYCGDAMLFMQCLIADNKEATIEDFYNACDEPMWLAWVAVRLNVPAPYLLDVCERLDMSADCWTVSNFNAQRGENVFYYYVLANHEQALQMIERNVFWERKGAMLETIKRVITLDILLAHAKTGENGWALSPRPNDEIPF